MPGYGAVRSVKKNTNRARCREIGYGCWNGKPAFAAAIGFAPGVCLMVDIAANNPNLRASRKVTSWNLNMEMATVTLSTLRVTWPIVKGSFIILVKMTLGLGVPHQI